MAVPTIAGIRMAATERPRDVAGWLGLAASPSFALMAWLSAHDAEAMLCSSALDVSHIGGMAWMYLLMSLFHLSPWLKLAFGCTRSPIQPTPQTRGD